MTNPSFIGVRFPSKRTLPSAREPESVGDLPYLWKEGQDRTVTAHLSVLEEKLNAYLRFVESGEIYAWYPGAKGRNIAIDVVLRHRPSEAGHKFLDQVHEIVLAAGLGFSYGPLSGGFVDDDA